MQITFNITVDTETQFNGSLRLEHRIQTKRNLTITETAQILQQFSDICNTIQK